MGRNGDSGRRAGLRPHVDKIRLTAWAAALVTALLLLPSRSPAQAAPASSGPEVRATVTVLRRGSSAPAAITAQDVLVYQRHERRPVVSWTPADPNGSETDLAILVDDSAASSLGNQLANLRHFITLLPSAMRVAVIYATHGNATVLQDFTTDHAAAAKALRLPVGRANEGSSIYMAAGDTVKHFPRDGHLHAMLLISDGIDLYRGVMDSQPGLNPDLNAAIEQAQRGGVVIYTIFANDAGLYRRNLFLVNNGQGSLSLLTLSTGGQSFFQGLETPISFQPYLQEVAQLLGEQYILTFRAAPASKSGVVPVRITTEQPGVQLLAPQSVCVP
ncbi:MAG: hypothetical protein ACRD1N_04160 [Terriglobia bacterium]